MPLRYLLFLFGCIPVRLLFAYLIYRKKIPQNLFILITLAISASFFILYFFNLRTTAVEAGNGKVWWKELRFIHGVLYFCAAVLVKYDLSWVILSADAFFGLISFIVYHWLIE